jgi:hypothetical protein
MRALRIHGQEELEGKRIRRRSGGYRAMGRSLGSTVKRDTNQELAGRAAKVV